MLPLPPRPTLFPYTTLFRSFTTSALSLSTIACGVPLGANSAVQLEASTSFTPASCRVGHSGLSFERLPMVKIGRAHVLNSSHLGISYAVFCLKKKKNNKYHF